MTRDELVTHAGLLYNEPSSSTAISTSNWTTFANTIHQEICKDCRVYPMTVTLTLVSGTRTYKLDPALAGIRRGGVITAASGQMTGPVTIEELSKKDPAWTTTAAAASAAPTMWYFESALVGSAGSQNFALGFYPVPYTTPPAVSVFGWGVPSSFSAGDSTPQFPTSLHDTIAWGMAYLAAVKDLDRAGRNTPKLNFFKQEYEGRKAVILQHMIDFGMEGWSFGPPTYQALTKAGAQ